MILEPSAIKNQKYAKKVRSWGSEKHFKWIFS